MENAFKEAGNSAERTGQQGCRSQQPSGYATPTSGADSGDGDKVVDDNDEEDGYTGIDGDSGNDENDKVIVVMMVIGDEENGNKDSHGDYDSRSDECKDELSKLLVRKVNIEKKF